MDPLLKRKSQPRNDCLRNRTRNQSGYWDGYGWSRKFNSSSKLQQYTKTYSYGGWKYVLAHSTKDVLAKFSKQYPKYTFKRTSINFWKASIKNNGNSQNLKKIGRPNLLSEELLKRTKDVIVGLGLAGTTISRRTVIAIGAGVVKANDSPPPSVFKYLYVVNNYTYYRNFNIICGATKIFADL